MTPPFLEARRLPTLTPNADADEAKIARARIAKRIFMSNGEYTDWDEEFL